VNYLWKKKADDAKKNGIKTETKDNGFDKTRSALIMIAASKEIIEILMSTSTEKML
jgi:hypothetical protein